jgi:hypothetical protein
MSGGSLNYVFGRVEDAAHEIRSNVTKAGQPRMDGVFEDGMYPELDPKTAETLAAIACYADQCAKLLRAAEWYLSGDYGDETFAQAVREALK